MLTLSQEKSNYKVEEVEMTDMIFGKGEDEDAGKGKIVEYFCWYIVLRLSCIKKYRVSQ